MSPKGLAWPFLALLALLVARRRLDVVEVRGRSMAPTLLRGDRLLVARTGAARVGDVVLAADPRRPGRELIKRVADIGPRGISLRGDNPAASTDARAFGPLSPDAVRWRVVWRYWPPRRAGPVPPAPARPR
ncbi:MAG TPA: S26 family signal peptidase [Candidatus Binatia bacterium]|nr:S26 family signal peptidase [Candidatus Binatia bacterium]